MDVVPSAGRPPGTVRLTDRRRHLFYRLKLLRANKYSIVSTSHKLLTSDVPALHELMGLHAARRSYRGATRHRRLTILHRRSQLESESLRVGAEQNFNNWHHSIENIRASVQQRLLMPFVVDL